jgi:hypothetical protein
MDDTGASRAAMWTYIGVMVGFKVVTVVFILIYTHTLGTIVLLLALHVPWIALGLVALGVPSAVYYRLIRMRRRRHLLIQQEFLVEPFSPETEAARAHWRALLAEQPPQV